MRAADLIARREGTLAIFHVLESAELEAKAVM